MIYAREWYDWQSSLIYFISFHFISFQFVCNPWSCVRSSLLLFGSLIWHAFDVSCTLYVQYLTPPRFPTLHYLVFSLFSTSFPYSPLTCSALSAGLSPATEDLSGRNAIFLFCQRMSAIPSGNFNFNINLNFNFKLEYFNFAGWVYRLSLRNPSPTDRASSGPYHYAPTQQYCVFLFDNNLLFN